MTWPGWSDVLPLLTTLVTAIATVIGAVVTWAKISDRTVSRAVEKAGRQSEKAVDRLYERLKSNDFRHVEERIESTVARIDRGLAEARADREAMETRLRGDAVAMEARIGDRIDRMGGRMESMEARILAAVERRPDDTDGSEA